MTSWVVINSIEAYGIDPDVLKVNILSHSASLVGTTASLIAGDKLSVTDLMYGMMLPSGNDAAQSLAIFFGGIFLK
jgi:D-alanyl-D-alanine carboxypeptidase (penicillin-binding protein 5/6)